MLLVFGFFRFRNPKYLFNLVRRTILHTPTMAHAPNDDMPKDGHEVEGKKSAFNVTHFHNKSITEQRERIKRYFFFEWIFVCCLFSAFISCNEFIYAHNFFDQFFFSLLKMNIRSRKMCTIIETISYVQLFLSFCVCVVGSIFPGLFDAWNGSLAPQIVCDIENC